MMNLWSIFPTNLISIPGIFWLPYLATLLYLFLLYGLFKRHEHRITLSLFFILTIIATSIMAVSLGSNIGLLIPPLMLLSVMVMPVLMLFFHCFKRDYAGLRLWMVALLAGWSHSIGWSVWLFALARS